MKHLFGDYYYSIIDEKEFLDIIAQYKKSVFKNIVGFNSNKVLSDLEKNKIRELKNNINDGFKLFIKIIFKEKTIGWFFGKQIDEETFNMVNTGIIEDYRNKGIYTKLLKEIFCILEEKGFQKVVSHHHATNNQVIIPKLKVGFIITGMEIDDKFGLMVNLTYFFNEKRKDIINFRVGSNKMNDIEKYLDFK